MLKCGIYESDITPLLGMGMPGYFHERPASGIKERLASEAVYLENDGERIVLVSNDSESMATYVLRAMREKISEALDIPVHCVCVCATHSHTAGPARHLPGSSDTGVYDPEYVEFLIRRTVDGAVMAARDAREVTLRFAKGTEDKLGYCRIYRHKDGSLRTFEGHNAVPYTEEIDHEVGVLRIDNTDGSPYGVLVSHACHCDCVGGTEISADYPGVMRQTLRRFYGEDFHPVYFNGFCGNINHIAPDGFHNAPEHYKRMGRMLAADVIRIRELADKDFSDTRIRAAAADVTIPARLPDEALCAWADKTLSDPTAGETDLHFAETIRNVRTENVPSWTVPVQVLCVGPLCFYAMPGEIFSEFSLMLKKASPLPFVIPVNLANAHVEYVPVREVFGYGNSVYEARVGAGLLAPEGGYLMTERLLELARQIV